VISAAPGERKGRRVDIPPRRKPTGGADHAAGTVERTRHELKGQQAMTLERAGQADGVGLGAREAEAAVIGRIADQDDRGMAAPARRGDCVPHQGRSDASIAAVGRHRDRPQQQCRVAGATGDVPQPRGADHAFAVGGDKSEALGRQAAFAQSLRGLPVPGVAEGLVEQRLARFDVGVPFLPQGDHGRSFPAPRARMCAPTERISRMRGRGGGEPPPGVCQMW